MTRPDPHRSREGALADRIAALRALAPPRLGRPLALVCTCADCIDPAARARLESAETAALSDGDAAAWWGAAFAFRRDGEPLHGGGRGGRASDHRAEAFVFFVREIEALAAAALADRGDGAPEPRLRPVAEPDMAAQRFFAVGFPETLAPRERAAIDAALLCAAKSAWDRGSPALFDHLDWLGGFGACLPALLDEVAAASFRRRMAFWGGVLAGRLGTPAAVAGNSWTDFRDEARIMPIPMAERLNAAFSDPRIGAQLLRTMGALRDERARDLALRALVHWENSVAATAMKRGAAGD